MATRSEPIETERLILRIHGVDDFEDMYTMWSDPAVTRYIGGKAFSREEVWARLLRYAGTWSLFGYGFWTIREKASGDFVGEVGFLNLRRDVEPPFGDRPELGYALAPWAHGKGFALEAARTVLRWGDLLWDDRETVCMIDPENQASLRVAAELGYLETSRGTYYGANMVFFSRRRPSADKKAGSRPGEGR